MGNKKKKKGRVKSLPFPQKDKMIKSPIVAKEEGERKTSSGNLVNKNMEVN